jgi:hypothetical protein
MSTGSFTNDTLTIKKVHQEPALQVSLSFCQNGTYLVTARTSIHASGTYSASLFLNGQDVAKTFSNGTSGQPNSQTTQINEVFSFKAGDRIQIYQTHNSSSINGIPNNQLSVVYLGA